MTTAELIRDSRERVHKWSQPEAAERLGWSMKTYQRVESGEREMTQSELETVSAVFGIAIERLHGYEPVCQGCGGHDIFLRRVR